MVLKLNCVPISNLFGGVQVVYLNFITAEQNMRDKQIYRIIC